MLQATETSPNKVGARICELLDTLAPQPDSVEWTTPIWTRRLKTEVAKLGIDLGYKVRGSSLDCIAAGGEYLVDLCWLQYRHGRLASVPLAMESEWGTHAVIEDFRKLVIVRAECRVMIFALASHKGCGQGFEDLLNETLAFGYSESEDRYLLSCWNNEDRGFIHKVYVFAEA